MQYGIVFKNGDTTDEKGTRIFNDMKEEMHGYNLKSKDIKKYIEYGWLYDIPGVKEDEKFKLNFRAIRTFSLKFVINLNSSLRTFYISATSTWSL